ncbi:MAG: hypothetical protein GY793_08520 [Proteobacteria bacterium]|nr:hypothetical protein [Pseudomonadota bacterium]
MQKGDIPKSEFIKRLITEYGVSDKQAHFVYVYCLDAYGKDGKVKTLHQINQEVGYSSCSGAYEAMASGKVKRAIDAVSRDLPKLVRVEMINRKIALARGFDAHGKVVSATVQSEAIRYVIGISQLVAPKAKEQEAGDNKPLDKMDSTELDKAAREIQSQMDKLTKIKLMESTPKAIN